MDNKFNTCPAIMSDGRFLSDNRTPTARNEQIKSSLKITRDDEYRTHLQKNATGIASNTWSSLKKNNTCSVGKSIHTYSTVVSHEDMAFERLTHDKLNN